MQDRHTYHMNRSSGKSHRASIGPYVASIRPEAKTERNKLLDDVYKGLFYAGVLLFMVLLDGLFKWQMWSASISIIR